MGIRKLGHPYGFVESADIFTNMACQALEIAIPLQVLQSAIECSRSKLQIRVCVRNKGLGKLLTCTGMKSIVQLLQAVKNS